MAQDPAQDAFSRYVGSLGASAAPRGTGGPLTDGAADAGASVFGSSRLDSLLPLELNPFTVDPKRQPTLTHIGRYELKSVISESGLGRLYEGWDPLASRRVAVKTLQFDVPFRERVTLDRLLLDAGRKAASLQHRHIAPMLEAGLSAHGVFLAVEFQNGRDLRHALALGWVPSASRAAKTLRRIADAVGYAHQKGMVHGGLKPANVMLDGDGRPRLLDFGLARAVRESRLLVLPDEPAGALPYTPPEVIAGQLPDARSDVYALGMMLYELLTGWQALPSRQRDEIRSAVQAGRAIAAQRLRSSVPAVLADLAERAASFDPGMRPADANAFAQELRGWWMGQPEGRLTQPAEMEVPAKGWSLASPLNALGQAARALRGQAMAPAAAQTSMEPLPPR